MRDVMVDQCGLVLHPTIERGAASPDGLVGTDGLVEIKCPKTATHIEYISASQIPAANAVADGLHRTPVV